MPNSQKVLAVDFDGVIMRACVWKGYEDARGVPVSLVAMKFEINKLKRKGWKVVIWSARSDIFIIRDWLRKYEIENLFDAINDNPWAPDNLSSARKIPATAYLDDRNVIFDGMWVGMAEKIKTFKPYWENKMDDQKAVPAPPMMALNQTPRTSTPCKNSPFLGTLPASILGYKPDQIAFFVPDATEAMEAWKKLGHTEWIEDEVFAISRDHANIGDFDPMDLESFRVKLCFNYDIMPCEFELISVVEGTTVQIPKHRAGYTDHTSGLSHIGFHVNSISEAVTDFGAHGFKVLSTIRTYQHRNCDHVYDYVFVDTKALGFITKLINRVK